MPDFLTPNLGSPAPGYVQQLAAGYVAVETRSGNRKASGTITYASNLSADDTITINGVVFTAKASGATGAQFNVGGSLTATLDNIVTVLNASTNPLVSVATYSNTGGTKLTAIYDTYGVAGNAFTLAASAGGTVSAATLENGTSDQPITINAETTLLVTTAGGNMDFVLPDGAEGQVKTLYFKTKGTSSNAIVTGTFGGGTTATFDAATDMLHLKWLNGAWRTLVATSVTIS